MDRRNDRAPIELDYRMPAQWQPHRATWLAWPHHGDTWPGKLAAMGPLWQRLVETLSEYEPVHILAGSQTGGPQAEAMVGHLPGVTIHDIPTNDCWIRDFGPTFVTSPHHKTAAIVDWRYDAWGGKYPPFDDDAKAAKRMGEVLGARRFTPDFVLEGGAIDVNGQGAALVTESCLLNAGRNPGVSRRDIERLLEAYLGVTHVVWLTGEMAGDDTDGHVDQMARFVGPRTIVAAVEQNPHDENYGPLRENIERLSCSTDQQGRSLEIIELPMPEACFHRGERLPASYANFYIAGGLVIVPAFGMSADAVTTNAAAAGVLSEVFPQRKIISLPAGDLVTGLGAFHCATLHQPQPPAARLLTVAD